LAGSICIPRRIFPSRRGRCIRQTAGSCLTFTPSLPRYERNPAKTRHVSAVRVLEGPRTPINSTRWIAESAKHVEERFRPTLTFVYLPHLDYNLQRVGPDAQAIAADLGAVDSLAGDLIDCYEARDTKVIVLSEYGIIPVSKTVHLNRVLRDAGLLRVREEMGLELLDPGASAAFAVADHQVAHVYVNDPSKRDTVRRLLEQTAGVDAVLDELGKRQFGIDHARAGEFVVVAQPDAWFTYYYRREDRKAPDFVRTVDIHRKPGYDPG
jgi:predicted AlkP superfamily pyrophosphatase or phosphodiesterase